MRSYVVSSRKIKHNQIQVQDEVVIIKVNAHIKYLESARLHPLLRNEILVERLFQKNTSNNLYVAVNKSKVHMFFYLVSLERCNVFSLFFSFALSLFLPWRNRQDAPSCINIESTPQQSGEMKNPFEVHLDEFSFVLGLKVRYIETGNLLFIKYIHPESVFRQTQFFFFSIINLQRERERDKEIRSGKGCIDYWRYCYQI